MTRTGPMLTEGRRAFAREAWTDAYYRLTSADTEVPLAPQDLERLATAAYLTGHDRESTAAFTRAHRTLLEDDDAQGAVRCAFWLGFGLLLRGDLAQGGGWISRAHHLVEDRQLDCVECGYLLVPAGLMSMGGGDQQAAYEQFGAAVKIGARFGDADLVALGRLGRGQVLLRLGRNTDGVAWLDETMVSVTAGEISPIVAGIVYCAVIEECRRVFDVRRAQEWTDALSRWCESRPTLVAYRGQCLVHRSQLMQLHGSWPEALAEAQSAHRRLSDPEHPALGDAHYQLGELHRLRGTFADAESAYLQAHERGRNPQPGLALLRLAQGRTAAATAAIENAAAEAREPTERAQLLPACVEIMLASGQVAAARAAADELGEIASHMDMPFLHAAAAQALGAVLLAEGTAESALERTRAAWRTWDEIAAPYEAARTRVLTARACRAVADHDTADLEISAARRAFERLGATTALAGLENDASATGSPAEATVTAREREVLRLVATGMTNRDVAQRLVISERTVERHLGNIFTKLGVGNRSAAAAAAYDLGLVRPGS